MGDNRTLNQIKAKPIVQSSQNNPYQNQKIVQPWNSGRNRSSIGGGNAIKQAGEREIKSTKNK